MRRLVVALVFLAACNNATTPVSTSTVASSSRALVAAPDLIDQPSFSDRTGRLPALSLQNLFHPTYFVPNDPSRIRTLLVTGDVIPARGVDYFATTRHDFLWPFRPTAAYTKNADITYINLESPLFAGCAVDPGPSFTFCGDARFVDGLTLMGAKVVNLANNHLSNYGAQGITLTDQLLHQHGMLTSGLGPVAVYDVRGVKFGFIGFNGVGRAIDTAALKASIAFARQQADIVVVQFHWGKEYERQPMADRGVPTPDDPVAIGHDAIDWERTSSSATTRTGTRGSRSTKASSSPTPTATTSSTRCGPRRRPKAGSGRTPSLAPSWFRRRGRRTGSRTPASPSS